MESFWGLDIIFNHSTHQVYCLAVIHDDRPVRVDAHEIPYDTFQRIIRNYCFKTIEGFQRTAQKGAVHDPPVFNEKGLYGRQEPDGRLRDRPASVERADLWTKRMVCFIVELFRYRVPEFSWGHPKIGFKNLAKGAGGFIGDIQRDIGDSQIPFQKIESRAFHPFADNVLLRGLTH